MENSNLCYRCKGKGLCGKKCKILSAIKSFMPKPKKEFSGSAPDIFVGRYDYPNVFTGILSPEGFGETERLTMPELWYEEGASIEQILAYRTSLIYSRFSARVNSYSQGNRLKEVMQEVAMAKKPVLTEFKLKREPYLRFRMDLHVPLIANPAPLEKARLTENSKVETKMDYLVSDNDAKAVDSVLELYKNRIAVSNIIKVFSSGLLGLKNQRRLVPSRWSITAIDDITSKFLLEKIKYYQEISKFMLFHAEYLGNHYEIILLPEKFEFEVIEAKMPGSVWNPSFEAETYISKDYESFFGRKEYAGNVTGAYYSNRLAVSEFLEKIKRQAGVLVLRECREEYYSPCGVGILREVSRDAFNKKAEGFSTLREALSNAQSRMKMPITIFEKNSKIIQNYGKQKKLWDF